MSESGRGWNIVGHEWAVDFLRRALDQGRLSHAYLFVGPPQVGKRTLALEFARTILCQGTDRPCGACRACQLARRGVHPDIETVRGEGAKGVILVDQMREVRRGASLSPVEGRQRIYVLCGMEFANENASNALLKVLEEPPAHVIFLLTATAEELLAPTIVSRCQVLALRPEPEATIQRALVARWNVPAPDADLLARLSGGRMGVALTLLGSKQLQAKRRELIEKLQDMLASNPAARFQYVRELLRRADELPAVLEVWLTWWRDILLLQNGLDDRITNADYREDLAARSGVLNAAQAAGMMGALQACAEQLQQNVNARLVLERLMLHLPCVISA